MITKHLHEVISLLNKADKIHAYIWDGYSRHPLKVSSLNYSPLSYDDIIMELSNGKTIYAKDLEFAEIINSNEVVLGNYHLSAGGKTLSNTASFT